MIIGNLLISSWGPHSDLKFIDKSNNDHILFQNSVTERGGAAGWVPDDFLGPR